MYIEEYIKITVIAGFVEKGNKKVYIGADRGLFDEETFHISIEPKIRKKRIGPGKNNYMIIGNSGDLKPQNIITHWKMDELNYNPEKQTPYEFLVLVLVPAISKKFKEFKYIKQDFDFLVGLNGELFNITDEYEVVPAAKYGSITGGAGVPALAVLYTLFNFKINPRLKIKKAIEASIAISNTATGNIDILVI